MSSGVGKALGQRAGLLVPLFPVLFSVVLLAATLPHLWRRAGSLSLDGPVGGPFHLVADDGRHVTDRSWPGRYLLIYFGYTHCPAACPTALNNVAEALNILGRRGDRVQPLFITIDPKRDTKAYLARYTAMFGKRILGLTGTQADLAEAARRYHVSYTEVRTGPDPDDYEFEHTSILWLMWPDGELDTSLPADEDPARLARDIRWALRS